MRHSIVARLSSSLLVLLLVVSCGPAKEPSPPRSIGAWIVYWDADRGLSELERYGSLFDRVSLFAYELDSQGSPRQPKGLNALIPAFFSLSKRYGFSSWVTLVNDVRTPEGMLRKDAKTVRRLITNPRLRRQHVLNIVAKVREDGFSGLDLDYENLDRSDLSSFKAFVEELAYELKERGLGLHVIMEPKKFMLSSLQYGGNTIMGYNLHGPHSGPGPRSTPDFLKKLSKYHAANTEGPELALAVGGFSWGPNGDVRQLDWVSGQQLSDGAVQTGRDSSSSVPYARLGDGTEVWFEDAASIRAKWDAASRAGYPALMIWRLGGNDESLFQMLYHYRR